MSYTPQEGREQRRHSIQELLAERQVSQAVEAFLEAHPGDQVEIFDQLEEQEQGVLLAQLDVAATAVLFSHQEDAETLEAAENLSIEKLADVLDEMDPDEAADLLGDLPPDQAAEALEQMEEAEDVRTLLKYPDETAGGRMTTEFIAIPQSASAGEAIEQLRNTEPDHEIPYYVFVTNDADELVGVTGLRELVVAQPITPLSSIMDGEVIYATSRMDQEEVAQIMTQYDLGALPVLDSQQKLVGVITHDDILDVVQEEATEDIYRLANVSDFELEPDSPIRV